MNYKILSIRSRVALLTLCISKLIKTKYPAYAATSGKVTNVLWDFVEADWFDRWEEASEYYQPRFILESRYGNLTPELFEELFRFYSTLPSKVVRLVQCAFEAAQGNLYGGIDQHSHFTLDPLLEGIEIFHSFELEILNSVHFEYSTDPTCTIWGEPVNRSNYEGA